MTFTRLFDYIEKNMVKLQDKMMSLSIIENTREKTEYVFTDDTGDAQIIVYHVFPGVEVAYDSVHMGDFDFSLTEKKFHEQFIGIHYCKEGRIEQEINNEFFYLMPGDCSIVIQDKEGKTFQFPLKHYHGISISIDLKIWENPLIKFLEDCDISSLDAAKHVCGEDTHIVLRSSEQLKCFFAELYKVDIAERFTYLRVKLPELFYHFTCVKMENGKCDSIMVSCTQVDFVKNVAEYISQNINDKITVKTLTKEFGVSDTYLQNSFRKVYGMPAITFIRVQKMQSAAQVLIHTTKSVDEIAEEFGYENESKFSAAFKKIMGDSPGVYRKEHTKVKVL